MVQLRLRHAILGQGDVGQRGAHQRLAVGHHQTAKQVGDQGAHGGCDGKGHAVCTIKAVIRRPRRHRLRHNRQPQRRPSRVGVLPLVKSIQHVLPLPGRKRAALETQQVHQHRLRLGDDLNLHQLAVHLVP